MHPACFAKHGWFQSASRRTFPALKRIAALASFFFASAVFRTSRCLLVISSPFFPENVVGNQRAGHHLIVAVAARFGDEAHAYARYLLRAHFLGRIHALSVGGRCIVEGAYTVQLHRPSVGHAVAQHAAQFLEHGVGVATAYGGNPGQPVGHLVRRHGLAHGDGTGIPLPVDLLF